MGVGIGALVAVQFVPGVNVAVDAILGIVGAVAYGMQIDKTIHDVSAGLAGFKVFLEKGFSARTGQDLNAARDGFKTFVKHMGVEAFKLLALIGDVLAVGKSALGLASLVTKVRSVFKGARIADFGAATMEKMRQASVAVRNTLAAAAKGARETVAHAWKAVKNWSSRVTDWAHHLFVGERHVTSTGASLGKTRLVFDLGTRVAVAMRHAGIPLATQRAAAHAVKMAARDIAMVKLKLP